MKLIKPDYLIIIGILFFVVAHIITHYLINAYQTTAEKIEIAKEVVFQYEGNPISRWFFRLEAFKQIYSFIIFPSVVVGFYSIVRRKNDVVPEITMAFAISFCMMGFLNAVNDFSVLLGFLMSLR